MKFGIKQLSFYLFFVFAAGNGIAQSHVIDSLKERLQNATQDTVRLHIYVSLADACEVKDNLTYCLPAIELADRLLTTVKDKKERAIILKQKIYVQRNIVYYYQQTRNNVKAIEYLDNSLKLAEAKGDSDEIAAMLIACGALYEGNSFLVKALDYNLKALPIFQGLKDKVGIAYCLGNLARIYADQGDNAKALTYDLKALEMVQEGGNKIDILRFMSKASYAYDAVGDSAKSIELRLKALSIANETGDKPSIATTLSYVGNFYIDHHSYAKAMDYILKGLVVVQQIGDFDALANSYGRIAKIYRATHEYDKAMQYYFKALSVCEHMGDKGQTNYNWMRIGQMYANKVVNYKLAKAYLDSAINGFKDGGQVGFLQEVYGSKSVVDSLTGDYKTQAVDMRYAFFYGDSLNNALKTHQAVQVEMKYEFDQLQLKEKAEQDKKDALARDEKRKQQIFAWSVTIGLILVVVFTLFVFRSLNITRKQKIVIEEQQDIVAEKNQNLEEAIRNIEVLNTIGKEITATLDAEGVMQLVYKNISQLMDVSFFIISDFNENDQTVGVKFCIKEGQQVTDQFKTKITDSTSLTALTIRNKAEIVIRDWENEKGNYLEGKHNRKSENDLHCESIIMIPLMVQNKLIGLFSVQSIRKNAYSESNITMLRSLAAFIAVALNNAESYKQINTAHSEISKQKSLVEEKNKDILDSITYAKRLQDAILPPLSTIKKHLPESFVLYKPKDIVAGDFYWLERSGDTILIAAADCTGHGVPGAMVSVVCSNALNRTVKEFKITEPGKILDKVRELVLETFEKSEDNVQDGMDISLAAIIPASPPSKGVINKGFGYEAADPILYGKLKDFVKEHRSIPTESEIVFWELVRSKRLGGNKFRRQHIIGQYIVDFVCLPKKLVIEIDGLIHQLPENILSDEERTKVLNSKGFKVIRFRNEEVIAGSEDVCNRILNELNKQPEIPPLEGGEATIQWAGAYNSLWYVQNGELQEIAADKQPIGKTDNPKAFTTHTIKLSPSGSGGAILYLFTDGYADQFGGEKGKKFKYKQLSEKLKVISEKSMAEQKQILEATLEEWQGNLEQVDDILIIGVRV